MLFHSQVFVLAFLPVTVALYYALSRSVAAREWLIIAASAVFYSWWDVRFLPLLVGQITVSWLIARVVGRTGATWLLPVGIAANLACLGVFKYLGFLIDVARDVTGLALPRSDIILPIGISFFTFQIVSYLMDLKRGDAPQYPLRRFALFIMLFPHLIAGPIVRHNEIIPQFDLDPRRPGLADRFSHGVALFVAGFAVKLFVADKLAVHVDRIFNVAAAARPSLSEAWAAAFGFSLQIYLDFAAYSEMAMGIAAMLGLVFPMNFNRPWRATSLREFWRRWHMSLSRFLRDYLYIPLGGSRGGLAVFAWSTMVTMGLCGLWHGAGWPFIIWGLAHGAGLVVCRGWQQAGLQMPWWLGWALTVLFAVLCFVVFRAPDMTTTTNMFAALLGLTKATGGVAAIVPLLIAVATAIALLPKPNPELVLRHLRPSSALAAGLAVLALYGALEVGRGQPVNFIYFQF